MLSSKLFLSKWLLVFLFFICVKTNAQEATKKTMPPFKIQLTDKSFFSAKDIKKDVPTMLVYFSPTCEHCQEFTKHMLEKSNAFKKLQIIMVTYLPLTDIKKFETDFQLEKYSNIKTGSEGNTFLVPKFYDIRTFPFIALFNNIGALQVTYRTVPEMETLIGQIKKI